VIQRASSHYIVAALAVSASTPCGAQVTAVDAARRSLAKAESLYSLAATHSLDSAYVHMLAANAYVLEAGDSIARGTRDGVAKLHASGAATGSWTPVRIEASSDGSEAYSYGYIEVRDTSSGASKAVDVGGKYIAYWVRARGGQWHALALIRNFQRHVEPGPLPSQPRSTFRGPANDTATARAAMAAADRAFSTYASAHSVADAFANFVAPDGAALSGGPRIAVGRDEIRASLPPTGEIALTWAPCHAHIAPMGDLGFTIGTSERRAAPASRPSFSKYLTVWRRVESGDWRYEVDGGNSAPGRSPACE